MHWQHRINLLAKLGDYILENGEAWQNAKQKAIDRNAWFTQDFIELAATNIATAFLEKEKLESWLKTYTLPANPHLVGVVMAGNIPLVGFHDFLCGFLCGHNIVLKPSEKDDVLLPHLVEVLASWDEEVATQIRFADFLKNCDAYIATGSNNSARYFEQYFGKYPHVIRRNRTSVAVLDGTETEEDFQKLGQDIFSFFGLGCRSVTQLCVPEGYDFIPLLRSLESFRAINDHNKYRNNYDYHLAIFLLNKVPYLDNGSLLLVENEIPFSAVSVLHYRYYQDKESLLSKLRNDTDIQAIVCREEVPFGGSQRPGLSDYADGVDTMAFLCGLG
ncbi:MAG: acyl-CoA reductase [Chitinophagaceae bacterium]